MSNPKSLTQTVALKSFSDKRQYDRSGTGECKSVIFFRNKVYPNEFLLKMFFDDFNHLMLTHTKISFNNDHINITEGYNDKQWRPFNQHYGYRILSNEDYYKELDEKLKPFSNNYEEVSPSVYNEFLTSYKKVIKENKRVMQLNKKNASNSLLNDNNDKRKIKFIYRALRQSGHAKKNLTLLNKKIKDLRGETGYDGEIEITEVIYSNTTVKIIDFIEQNYLIVVSINNVDKKFSETTLINISEKTNLFKFLKQLKPSNLNRALGNKIDIKYTNLIKLFKEELDVLLHESKPLTHFNIKYRINSIAYNSNELFSLFEVTIDTKTGSKNTKLYFSIVPTDNSIELVAHNYNHKNILSLISQISKDLKIDNNMQLAMIEELEELDDSFANTSFLKENLNLPEFKSIKQMLSWLKLKKINIIL
jgi:hypothetical protein